MQRVTVSTGPDDAFIDVIDVYFALYADMMINVARINVVQIVIFQQSLRYMVIIISAKNPDQT